MLSGVEIFFLKEPASQDELAITEIIRTYAHALKERDHKILLSLFDKEARIDSYTAGETVSVADFAKIIPRALTPIVRVSFKAIVIKVISERNAFMFGVTRYDYQNRLGRWHGRTWEMIKNNDKWYIISSKYNDFRPKKS